MKTLLLILAIVPSIAFADTSILEQINSQLKESNRLKAKEMQDAEWRQWEEDRRERNREFNRNMDDAILSIRNSREEIDFIPPTEPQGNSLVKLQDTHNCYGPESAGGVMECWDRKRALPGAKLKSIILATGKIVKVD